MANKKKRTPPRPQSGSGPAAKRPGQPAAARAGGAAKSPGPRPSTPVKAVPKPARDRTGPTRSQRLAAAEAARQRKADRTRRLIALGMVAVLALLTVTIVRSRRSNDAVVNKLEASGACSYDSKADSDNGPGKNHVTGDLTYKVNPPGGGNHNPSPASSGTFTADTAPPDPRIVHALEHGYVAVWYRPDIDTSTLDDLKALAAKYPKDVLLVPRASMVDEPVAATTWHRRLLCERPDVDALDRFVTSYRNKGPEKVPH